MKAKTAVAILLVAIFALSSIATIAIKPAKATGGTLTLSDTELTLPEFDRSAEWGPGSETKTDVSGPGVQFDFTGLTSSGTGVGDNYPVNAAAGGAGAGSDFTAYGKYSMLFINVGSSTVSIHLFMNTGWSHNTFWASNWVTIGPHESAIITLDFSSCGQAYGCSTDPVPEWVHDEGTGGFPVRRLDQVSNIGFEVTGNGSASVIVSGTLTQLYIDPPVVNKASTDVNSFFDVFVTLSDFTNLAGFDIKLTWNNNLITETSHSYTTYLDALWGASNWDAVVDHTGADSYELAATALATSASNPGATVLFKKTFQVLRSSNFPVSTSIHFALVKLSDNTTPVPNPIPATLTDGLYNFGGATPDLEFNVLKQNKKTLVYEPVTLPGHFEYCNKFEVQVYVTHISANSPLQDYDISISFDHTLARFLEVDAWGVLGTGSVSYAAGTDVVEVSCTNLAGWSGDSGLLFTLTFHVEFAATANHIWKKGNINYMTFPIAITDATLSFGTLGTIGMSGITMPSPLTFEVDFIRGDVTCDGVVNMDDISAVAYWYNHPATDKPEYDLNNDGTIDIYDIVTVATNYGYGLDP